MSNQLEKWNRVWIIGASSGMGAALAELLAHEGVEVVVSARRAEKLEALGRRTTLITPLPLDVKKPDEVAEAVESLHAAGTLPDLTIYCAAIYEPGGMDQLGPKKARQHMEVNYLGAVAVISALFPKLKERGTGSIAIVSSLTSYCGLPLAALYGPTKAALASLCETIKPEFDQAGLQLQLVNPGFVDTPLTEKNSFPMPFILSREEAAQRILKGLKRSTFEIAFPTRMAVALGILRRLPYGLYFRLMWRML